MGLFNDEEFDNASSSAFFKFETAGDTVEGEVLDIALDKPSEYGLQDIVTIKTDAGTYKVGARTILQDKLRSEGLKVGSLVGIRYNGEKENKTGTRTYKDYSVVSKTSSLFADASKANDKNVPF